MENRCFGIIVKVHDLERCRTFYRDLLGLGEPEMDSSFVASFALPGGATLSLQSCSAAYLEHENSATSWAFGPTDIEVTLRRLRENGHRVELHRGDGLSRKVYRGSDPEGNVFYLQPNAEKEEGE